MDILAARFPVRYAASNGRFRAELFFRDERLHYKDLAKIHARVASGYNMLSEFDRFPPTRTAVFPLDAPIQREGLPPILSVRAKGVSPTTSGKYVNEHFGNGAVDRPITVKYDSAQRSVKFAVVQPNNNADGVMLREHIETEINTAEILGEETTDPILGFGKYYELKFRAYKVVPPYETEKDVGFVLYGITSKEDRRLHEELYEIIPHLIEQGVTPDAARARFSPTIRRAGQLLRIMHNNKLVHQYPHIDNFRVENPSQASESIKLVDLDSARNIEGLHPWEKAAWKYKDLRRFMQDLLPELVRDNRELRVLINGTRHTISLYPLIEALLSGYAPELLGTGAIEIIMKNAFSIMNASMDLEFPTERMGIDEFPLIVGGEPVDQLMELLLKLR